MIHECGDITGIYYLVISGLPWTSTWQSVKDLVRYPKSGGIIDVQHVCIYPSKTDGWVKLHNKEDFNRAYEDLNGRVYQGKSILADNRNGHTIVNLRDMAAIQTNSSPDTYYDQPAWDSCALSSPRYNEQSFTDSSAMYLPSTQNSQQHVYRPGWPNCSADRDYIGSYSQLDNYSSTPTYSGIGIQPTNYKSCASYSPTQYDCVPPPNTQPLYRFNPLEAPIYTQQLPIGYQPSSIPISAIPQLIPTPPPAFQRQYPAVEKNRQIVHVQSVPRKIIITHLPRGITKKELQVLLECAAYTCNSHSEIQLDEYPIESFQLVRQGDGRVKGHAFATFFSPSTAKRVAGVLHGRTYRSQELGARLTKEGVESILQAPPIPEQQAYTPTSGYPELACRMGGLSMTASSNTALPTTIATKPKPEPENDSERRGRTKSRSGQHSTRPLMVVGIERDRSSGTQSNHFIRGPLVANGSRLR